jgi:hypothetical protein
MISPLDPLSVSLPGRTEQGNGPPLVPLIDSEIAFVDGGLEVTRIQFTHPNYAKISQIGMTIGIASGQIAKVPNVLGTVESHFEHSARHRNTR